MSRFPSLQLRCLVWGILCSVQAASSISEQKEDHGEETGRKLSPIPPLVLAPP